MTSDNPRSEEPLAIIEDVLQGTGTDVEVDPDRARAIAGAIALGGAGRRRRDRRQGARAGPGVADGIVTPFDDREVAREALRRRDGAACGRQRSRGRRVALPARLRRDRERVIPLGGTRSRRSSWASSVARRPTAWSAGSTTTRGQRGPGDLFVALNTGVGLRRRGRSRAGAATLVPDDQEAALAALASLVRSTLDATVVAVVGSTGKTSTKDALGALCAAVTPTVAAEASQNNEIGLPLTVLRLEPDTRGARRPRWACAVSGRSPSCARSRARRRASSRRSARSTSSSSARSRASRAANAEAIEALPPGGVAVVPADEPRARAVPGTRRPRRPPRSTGPRSRRPRHRVTCRIRRPRVAVRRRGAASVACSSSRSTSDTWRRTCSRRSRPTTRSGCRSSARRRAPRRSGSPAGAARCTAAGRRGRRQRRLQREPDVDAGRAGRPRRACGGRRRVAILGEMAELGEQAPATTPRSRELLAGRWAIEVVVAVGERARAYLAGATGGAAGSPTRPPSPRSRTLAPPGRRGPREGVTGGRARRHRRPDREARVRMVSVLIAGLVAMVIAIVIGPTVHRMAAPAERRPADPRGRAKHHLVKQGTPTMGGLLILVAAIVAVPHRVALHAARADACCSRRSPAPRSASPTTT